MASDIVVGMKESSVHEGKIEPVDIHGPNSDSKHSEAMGGTFRQWRQWCVTGHVPADSAQMSAERPNQLIRSNRRITTRELCTELNVGFNALETMLAKVGTDFADNRRMLCRYSSLADSGQGIS
jgi:hypothetical protein